MNGQAGARNLFIQSDGAAEYYVDDVVLLGPLDEADASTDTKGSGYIPLRNPLYVG
jgi:hypothetical protein